MPLLKKNPQFLRTDCQNLVCEIFFSDIGDVTLVQNLFRLIRFINRTNTHTIWTPTYEDIGHIAKKTSNPPPKKINPHIVMAPSVKHEVVR